MSGPTDLCPGLGPDFPRGWGSGNPMPAFLLQLLGPLVGASLRPSDLRTVKGSHFFTVCLFVQLHRFFVASCRIFHCGSPAL